MAMWVIGFFFFFSRMLTITYNTCGNSHHIFLFTTIASASQWIPLKENCKSTSKPHLNTTCSVAECASPRVSVSLAGLFSDSLNRYAYFRINSLCNDNLAEQALGLFHLHLWLQTDRQTKLLGFAFSLPVQPHWIAPHCASDGLFPKWDQSNLDLSLSEYFVPPVQHTSPHSDHI